MPSSFNHLDFGNGAINDYFCYGDHRTILVCFAGIYLP